MDEETKQCAIVCAFIIAIVLVTLMVCVTTYNVKTWQFLTEGGYEQRVEQGRTLWGKGD